MVLLTQSNPRLTSVGGDEGNYTRWIMHFLSLMNSMLVPAAAYNACLSIEKRKTMSFHQYWEMKVGSEMFLHISILPSFDMLPM